jgi:ribose 1,5-bisphosphokinase
MATMRKGLFLAIVGPSGSGKDTIIEALCKQLPNIKRVKRYITREQQKAGGEDSYNIDFDIFGKLERDGGFAFSWSAHHLKYGLPITIFDEINVGKSLIANISRSILDQLSDKFEYYEIILITASDKILAERLEKRGRESKAQIEERLARSSFTIPNGISPLIIRNETTVEDAVSKIIASIYPNNSKRLIK